MVVAILTNGIVTNTQFVSSENRRVQMRIQRHNRRCSSPSDPSYTTGGTVLQIGEIEFPKRLLNNW